MTTPMDGRYERQFDDGNAALAQNWWALALRGIFGIVFGLIALVVPWATMLSLLFVYAAYMIADGLFAIVAAVRAMRRHERWGLLILEGVADLAAAAIALLWPGITVIVFVFLIAAWAIITGALALGAAFRLRMDHGRPWLVLAGIASLVYGVLLFLAPLAGALVLTWWIGAYALVFGISLLVLAFRLRARSRARPWRA